MKIIFIDDRGATCSLDREHIGKHPVMMAAQEHIFAPCPTCGLVCFPDDMDMEAGECKYCTGEYEATGRTSDDYELTWKK